MLAFVPVLAAAFCLEQLVRAEGAARQVMIALIASTVANLVFDVVFILVLGWGVAGAALAMGLANLGVLVYFVGVAAAQQRARQPGAALVHAVADDAQAGPRCRRRRAAAVGVPHRHALVLNNLAAAYGDAPLAAMGVAVRIAQVPEFLVMGVTFGVLPLLAYSFGKGDSARLRSALRASALTVGGIVGLLAGVSSSSVSRSSPRSRRTPVLGSASRSSTRSSRR